MKAPPPIGECTCDDRQMCRYCEGVALWVEDFLFGREASLGDLKRQPAEFSDRDLERPQAGAEEERTG